MKTIFILLTAFFAIGTTVSAQTKTKKEIQTTTYTCPMHPKEVSAEKGKCSKCGMKLVATKESTTKKTKENKTNTSVKTKYVCTMDGATSEKPGKCPKCGMALTEKKSDDKEVKH